MDHSPELLPHWKDGGNAVTNFEKGLELIYEMAIKESGDSDLYIGPPTPNGSSNMKALRMHLSPYDCSRKSLSHFWNIYDQIKMTFELIQAT